MPTEEIPFSNRQESGYDELAGGSTIAMNVIQDPKGAVSRRPGIQAYSGAPSTVIDSNGLSGIYVTTGGLLFTVGASGAERPIYKVTSGGALKLGGGIAPSGLRGTARPTFAETELLLVIAGGETIEKIVLPLTSDRLGGSPPKASHVIANNTRLLANDVQVDRTKVRFSDTALGDTSYAGHEVWSLGGVGTSGYFTAEANPDDVVGLYGVLSEVLVFGSRTTQVFLPDAATVYSPGPTIEIGMSAPYSFVHNDREVYWIDNFKRMVASDRRSFAPISDPIQRQLDDTTTSDAFGYRVSEAFFEGMVWTLPTDGRTFCWQKGIGWSQWCGWNDTTDQPTQFSVTGLTTNGTSNIVCTSDGKVGEFALDANTDFGTRINAYVVTGYQNRKTDNRKHCKAVRLSLRRGTSSATPGPVGFLQFRDRPGDWSSPIPVDFGSSGDFETVVTFYSLGVYRRRQWMFTYSDTATALALISATEEYEVLSN
jgi:hypothetical protein